MLFQKIRRFLCRLLLIIYPEHCGFCGREISAGKWVCAECAERVELVRCDGSIPEKYNDAAFDRLFYAGIYADITRDGMLRLKKGKGHNAANYLSLALVRNISASDMDGRIDCITYIPVSPKKRRRNGFDHAEVMAQIISGIMDIPIEDKLILRKNVRKSQHSQRTFAKRRKHAKAVYIPPKEPKSLDGKIILLCDDILTSGATLSRCSDILKAQGAVMVCAAALVRAGNM